MMDPGLQDKALGSVQGQRYAADGSVTGGEFQVNAWTTGQPWGSPACSCPI
jgi:hypothetical protein